MNDTLWKECIKFHGHACPGLATGYRASEVAMAKLGIPMERATDEEVVCITENEACGVDAVQYLLSCTAGKGNLIFRPSGKMAFTFYSRKSGKGVRIIMKNFDRSGDREEMMMRILTAPADEVLDIKEPKEKLPEKARMFDSMKCDKCGEYCREDKIRFQGGKKCCLDCFDPYNRG